MVRPRIEPELAQVHPHAAGIDIGGSEHWVSIPAELDPEPVRKFSCFTADLYAIAEWLKSRGITTVAMESTGVYKDSPIPNLGNQWVRSSTSQRSFCENSTWSQE
jgi:hypothetical protein